MSDAAKTRVPWVVASDLDGFFGLFIDNLVNLIIIASTMMGLFEMPANIVLGKVIPGAAMAILAGNAYYTYMARRLARRTGRRDVTTLPYGISTPIMFAYLFLVIGPVYRTTGDPELAWRVGVASAFIGGIVEFLGAFVGGAVRRYTPRPALLGTLAGIAIVWIAMKPTVGIWEHPLVGMIPLALVLVGFVARIRMPLGLPTGFVVVLLGSMAAWLTGLTGVERVTQAAAHVGFKLPTLAVGDIMAGLDSVVPYLMVVLPMGIYNFIETMNNVESAAAAGDPYPTREAMVVDGIGTMVGALFGGCFPTTVYIGHPGWKAVGARTGYTLLNGVAVFVISLLGMMTLAEAVVPKEVAFIILLYVALVIGAQAFQTSDEKYAPAVILAFVPHIAAYASNLIETAVQAAGSSTSELAAAFQSLGLHYQGLKTLGQGGIITGLLLGAMAVFLVDRKMAWAALYAVAAAVLTFFGFIHAGSLGVAVNPEIAGGYLAMAVVFGGLHLRGRSRASSPPSR